MGKINRRSSLKYLGLGSLAAGTGLVIPGCEDKREKIETGHDRHGSAAASQELTTQEQKDQEMMKQKFFTEEERKTVRVLADIILPRDDRSGNASDAGVPEFIEFMMLDQPNKQVPMRGGLKWLNNQCLKRYDKAFVECSEPQQTEILDAIAWPAQAKPEMSQGVAFFNSFRDLVASGFWTSKMGIEDLQYMGNVGNPNWNGCPEEACQKLGVSNS
ncbi:gluconate 2-dehydrogenase subunit 3 family protein [Adhaeribacter aquaticus]|uniref:gluconate 2-dehydrogenase subunit 3 family protein n=1 Tax=Adhaeribacter aquaticus TaxID=299567 RepID=UPI00040733E5|nr:gluconate 2-dehydrogenase subunit 3 family protein [Adhaeribacter aquaticus]